MEGCSGKWRVARTSVFKKKKKKFRTHLTRKRGGFYLSLCTFDDKKALELIMNGSGLSEKVAANTSRFRNGMTSAGFQILGENHPICPVFLGDAKLAADMAEKMQSKVID